MTEKKLILYLNYKTIAPLLNYLNFIPYAIVKGEVTSLQAYGDVARRHLGDVDILIPKKYIFEISKILLENGFKKSINDRTIEVFMQTYSHQTPSWYKYSEIGTRVDVDINFDIFWGEHNSKNIDVEEFLNDTEEITIFDYKIKILTPMKSLLHLILHSYKDMNSIFILATRNKISIGTFSDIYNFIINNDIQADSFYRLCKKYSAISYAYYVLYYTNMIYKSKSIKKFINVLESEADKTLLNTYGLSDNERKEWKIDFITRLHCENLYKVIEKDLTSQDIQKILLNKQIFTNGKLDSNVEQNKI